MKSNIKIGHLNVRSLYTGFNELIDIINNNKLDILALSETWLSEDTPLDAFSIPGFNLYRKDRLTRGGGVAVYIRDSINAELITINYDENCIEQLWLKFRINRKILALAVFYRPPSVNIHSSLEQLDSILSFLLPTVDYAICLGDINVNLFNIDNPVSQCFECYGFTQVVNEPTRVSSTASTLIDPIFVSDKNLVVNSQVVNADEISDHRLAFCELSIKINKFKSKFVTFRDFKNFNYQNFYTDLISVQWNDIIREPDINNKIQIFTDYILTLYNKHAPVKTVRVTKAKAPWLTEAIKMMMKERDKALRRYKTSETVADWNNYKEIRNMTLSAIRAEKKAYMNSVFNQKNLKQTWNTLRELNIKNNDRINLPESLCDAEQINNYLGTVFQNSNCNELVSHYNCTNPLLDNNFEFKLATVNEVNNAIKQIKSNAYGSDNVSLTMLRYCSPFLDPYITHIVNVCFENNFFPDEWKVAIIHPLPKVNSPSSFSDLRPISLLTILSKIFEKIIYQQVSDYVLTNNILPATQSGFRKGHSTATALLNILDNIVRDIDKKNISVLVLLDFSRAFDTINHDLLCAKLRYYGFSDNAAKLINSYLSNRYQKVVIGGSSSSLCPIKSGVPQGSVLGPLLFVIYTADLLNQIEHASVQSYADDTQLKYDFTPQEYHIAEYQINCDLQNIKTLSDKHNLKLNATKSMFIVFGGQRAKPFESQLKLNIGNQPITVCSTAKILGVLTDSNLKFTSQVSAVIKKSFYNLKLLYANRHVLNHRLRVMLSESLVLSFFNYCDFVYGPFLDVKEKGRIQKLQNSCCKFVFGLRKYDHVSDKINELRWLTMKNRRTLHFAVLIQKLMLTSIPSYLKKKLIPRRETHNFNIRFPELLTVPKHSTALYRKCFSFQTVELYNKLPNSFRNFNISTFKIKMKSKLLNDQ